MLEVASTGLSFERFVIKTHTERGGGFTLRTVFNRYRRGSGEGLSPGKPGTILFLCHGIGHHKELWEPMLSRLFAVDDSHGAGTIREAWAMDGPNHGESARMNEELFTRDPFVPIYETGEVFATLYRSGLLGAFDPKVHKVAIVGHSGGAVIAIASTQYFPGPPSAVPYSHIILIEPAMTSAATVGKESELFAAVKSFTPTRRDIWPTREAAIAFFAKRIPWAQWDPRILHLYAQHGLVPLPTALYPDQKAGFTLATTRVEEARGFYATKEALEALHRLNQISSTIPTHLIFGENEDLYPEEVRSSLNSPSEGRIIASTTHVPDAGHLVVQEAPDKLAHTLFSIIKGTNTRLDAKL